MRFSRCSSSLVMEDMVISSRERLEVLRDENNVSSGFEVSKGFGAAVLRKQGI